MGNSTPPAWEGRTDRYTADPELVPRATTLDAAWLPSGLQSQTHLHITSPQPGPSGGYLRQQPFLKALRAISAQGLMTVVGLWGSWGRLPTCLSLCCPHHPWGSPWPCRAQSHPPDKHKFYNFLSWPDLADGSMTATRGGGGPESAGCPPQGAVDIKQPLATVVFQMSNY